MVWIQPHKEHLAGSGSQCNGLGVKTLVSGGSFRPMLRGHCPGALRATTRFMPDVISEYQKWKAQGESLRSQAKQAMESRFRELLTEAASLAEEYRADFGAVLKPPSSITAFRYKASGKAKARKPGKAHAARSPEIARPRAEPAKPDPKVAGLQKRLLAAKKKLEEARAAGASTRNFEDRVYEIEDALRLTGQQA